MRYIDDIRIESFKGIRNLELLGLSDINILVGENNTCKTSVLEAVQLLQHPTDFRDIIMIARKRETNFRPNGFTQFDSFMGLFNKEQNKNNTIKVSARINDSENTVTIKGEEVEVIKSPEEMADYYRNDINDMDDIIAKAFKGKIEYEVNKLPKFSEEIFYDEFQRAMVFENERRIKTVTMKYITPLDHLIQNYSVNRLIEIIEKDEKKEIINLLKMFDENIEGVELLPGKGPIHRSIIYLRHKKYGLMPISSFGDGVKKAVTIATAIINAQNGVLLIDEIETAIHTSAFKNVFRWLVEACEKYRVQLIATTHSFEALEALLENLDDNLDMATIFRLEKFEEEIIARRFSGKKAKKIVIENGGDLR